MLDELGIDHTKWIAARSMDELGDFIENVGFPVLVRPSYVLSGAAMKVAYDKESLDRFLGAQLISQSIIQSLFLSS